VEPTYYEVRSVGHPEGMLLKFIPTTREGVDSFINNEIPNDLVAIMGHIDDFPHGRRVITNMIKHFLSKEYYTE
jgi:hypothetical protein